MYHSKTICARASGQLGNMSSEQEKIKENFARNLKATEYMDEMAHFWSVLPDLFRSMIKFIHEVFNSGKFTGSKLLEIGSGATVHSIASASEHFDSIVMTDYVEDNLEHLKRWLKGESPIKQFLDIQAGLEGYGNDLATGRRIIESRIRNKVKRVTRCDVLDDSVLLEGSDAFETSPPFDAVVSCLCLEVTQEDIKGYTDILRRVGSLLRPGGGLLLCGFLQGDLWKVRENVFHHIQIDEADLLGALKKAGFVKVDMKTFATRQTQDLYYKHDKLFCLTAEKARK